MPEPRIALPPRVSSAALARSAQPCAIKVLRGTALGTSWRVDYGDRADSTADQLHQAIGARLAGLVDEMSQWEPGSLLSRFNRAPAGTWFALPSDFATVLAAALDVAAQSDGAFDPTHGRAAALLGFGAERVTAAPAPAALAAARATAGWQRLAFERGSRRVQQPGGLWLDFSGIAKGHAGDAIADLMRDAGVDDALVEVGGELVGRGLKPGGQPWWVDLEPPPNTEVPPLRIALHELAVATSGHYVRGAHTIDPRTGRALLGDTVSVSVIHDSAMLADAWATAVMAAGPSAGMALAARAGLAVRIVTAGRGGPAEALSPKLAAMIEG